MGKRIFNKRRAGRSEWAGLKLTAMLEAIKGVLVLVAGFGLLTYIHRDLHHAAVQLVRHFHLNPASHYPTIFLDLSARIHDTGLWAMAAGAFIYASIRIAEAIGLWLDLRWAEWFGVLSGLIYIPVEVYEITRGVAWPKVVVLIVNSLVIGYLLRHLIMHRCR